MKNKLFIIVLSAILALPAAAWADDIATSVNNIDSQAIETLTDNELISANDNTTYKEPISKRKIAKKFLLAMGGVAISSFAIFFLLTVYNRIRENCFYQIKTPEGETPLKTPDDLNEAVKIFLDKTKW